MNSKETAESALAKLPLQRTVTVSDVDRGGTARRAYSYETPHGNLVEIEIDAVPSDEQLDTLARHLPLEPSRRTEALATMKGNRGGGVGLGTKLAIGAAAAVAAYEIANQLGLFN